MSSSDSSITQLRPKDMFDLFSCNFQPRYEAQFAWSRAVSSVLALPNLRAFWPGSCVGYQATDQDRDIAGGGHHLTPLAQGAVTFGYDRLAPYVEFTGADYTERADGGAANWADITGAETWVPAAQQGLSLGGWFLFDALGSGETMLSKYGAAGSRSYRIAKLATNVVRFTVSNDGTATTNADGVTTVSAATWYFVMGVFDNNGNTIKVWLNDASWSQAYNNAIFDSGAAFRSGFEASGSNYHNGKQSLRWLCGCALSDSLVFQLFHQQRALFNV